MTDPAIWQLKFSKHTGRDTASERVLRYVPCYHRVRGDHRAIANTHAGHD